LGSPVWSRWLRSAAQAASGARSPNGFNGLLDLRNLSGYQRAEQLLHKHRAKVERLAAELIASRKVEPPLLDQLLADALA
jgi:hypothetical protein